MPTYDAPQTASAPASAGKLPEGAYCSEIRVKRSENDGFIVTHHYEQRQQPSTRKGISGGYAYIPPRDFVFTSADQVAADIAKAFPAAGGAKK